MIYAVEKVGDWVQVWETPPPDEGVKYQVLEAEWDDIYPMRIIKQIHVTGIRRTCRLTVGAAMPDVRQYKVTKVWTVELPATADGDPNTSTLAAVLTAAGNSESTSIEQVPAPS